MMKFLLPALFVVVAVPALAQDKKPACIRTSQISSSHPTDDERAILFTMRNGDVWRNDLRSRCMGLRFEGIIWTLNGGDRVCSNQQTFQLLESHSICALGNFTLLPKKP